MMKQWLTAPLLTIIRELTPHVSEHVTNFQDLRIEAALRCTAIKGELHFPCFPIWKRGWAHLFVQVPSRKTTISLSHPFLGTVPSLSTIWAVILPCILSKLGLRIRPHRRNRFFETRYAITRRTGRATTRHGNTTKNRAWMKAPVYSNVANLKSSRRMVWGIEDMGSSTSNRGFWNGDMDVEEKRSYDRDWKVVKLFRLEETDEGMILEFRSVPAVLCHWRMPNVATHVRRHSRTVKHQLFRSLTLCINISFKNCLQEICRDCWSGFFNWN